MSFTLIMAVTAAVAATMGYMAARRKGEHSEAPPKDGPPKGAKKAEPKPHPAADPKAIFAGMPLTLGDVVAAEHEERWLAGALVAREDGVVLAALFVAPEGKK